MTITIDRPKVQAAIEAYVATIKDFALKLKATGHVKGTVEECLQASERFLPKDLAKWDEHQCEAFTSRSDTLGNSHMVQGTQDIVGITHAEQLVDIVDWKRVNHLDHNKVLAYANSWQPVTYINYYRHTYPGYKIMFSFRFYVASRSAIEEVSFELSEPELNGRLDELNILDQQMQINLKTGIWTRNSRNCFAYRRLCPFFKECWEQIGVPVYIQNPQRSQSLYDLYTLCQQKYARTMAVCESDDKDYHDLGDSELPAVLGLMFHNGMEEIYNQAAEQRIAATV